jgi:hypothetical protein
MNKLRIVKRSLIGAGAAILLFILGGIIFSYIYKDEIIGLFINETNKHITTPIDVEKIEVSIFNHFPNISVNLLNVIVKESSNDHEAILGKARVISASFNPINILRNNYVVEGIHLSDGEVNLVIDKQGAPNYLLYKKDSSAGGGIFYLQDITCKNMKVDYVDQKSDYHVAVVVKNAKAQLTQSGNMLSVDVNGDLVSDEIRVNKRRFLNNKTVDIVTAFDVNLKERHYHFESGKLRIDKGEFEVTGTVNTADKYLDLKVQGLNTNFQSINSLLSSDLAKYFRDYNSKGNVYFQSMIQGSYSSSKIPNVNIEFGAKKASFFHPAYKKQIKNVDVEGHFTTGKANRRSTYRLDLKNFSCSLEDKRLEGSLALQNFDDYHLDLVLKGAADVNTLLLLMPKKYVKTAFGNVMMDIHVNGKLKDPKLTQNINANGEITLQNISFVPTGKKLPLNKINGSLILRNNDLAVSDLEGFIGRSDFKLNGFVKDISRIFSNKNQAYRMQADLQSRFIDFDELLKSNFASRDTVSAQSKQYEFKISPKITLDFNCEVKRLNFRRFKGRNIIGNIAINDQIAVLKNVSFASMGGNVNISGSVNSKRENLVETISEAYLYNINVDSVFYVFKNFNQNWLIDKNLKGQLDAEVNLYMNFNKNLVLNSNSLVADINTSIANGELNDFEPMMELSKFVEEESLAKMRFSRMTNEIKIENRTIYLPEMEIGSNVSNILVSGTHTFDNYIDYHLSVPLKSFIRISRKKDYQKSARNGMNLLLKLSGHTSDYKISYDTKALKENLKKDFTDERREWKNIKNKDTAVDSEVPEFEEEYFDFEESAGDSTVIKN